MSLLRLGLAGFGRLARGYYLPALARLPGARLVAVADPRPESRAAALARGGGVRATETVEELLGESLDGLLVASPPSTHLAAWRAACAVGVPAFVEKPLVLSKDLARVAEDADARVMVDFNRRFWPPYARARRAIRSGALGAPVAIDFQLHLDVLGWSTVTRHRLAAGEGGLVHDLGSHAIDLASWMTGEAPSEIAAVATTRRWPNDQLRLTLTFPSGATARADLAYGSRTRERIAARGPAGRLWQDEPNMALHVRAKDAPPSHLPARMHDVALLAVRGLWRARSFGRASIAAALAAFLDAVRRGEPFAPGAADGIRNAHEVAAAVRSLAEGGRPARP